MSLLSDKVADPQYDGLSSAELSALLNDANGAESTATITDYNVNAKQVLSVLGATAGAVFLDALEVVSATNSAVKWTLTFLKSESGINVGDIETRNSLDDLATAGVLDGDSVATVKALAESSISWAQDNKVIVNPWEIEQARLQP
mgnify:FL=1